MCVTIVARALIVTLTFICFLLIGLGFDQAIKLALALLDAPPSTVNFLSNMTLLYVLLIGIGGTLTSTIFVVLLAVKELLNPLKSTNHSGDDSE